ncbi:MAG: transposase family protein [Planctomycetes bacterium]|nr:transposase family protein [Planctomycetota bacterium]
MPLDPPASFPIQDAMRDLALKLDNARHGEAGDLIKSIATHYGWNSQRIYRELKKIGWSSGRKRRSDAGESSQDIEALTKLATAKKMAVRLNGKATLHTTTARSILAANGHEFKVGNARINTLLRDNALSLKQQTAPTPVQSLRSLHPNHVHLVDPSLCLIYYLPEGGQAVIRDDEAYKNKPENIERLGDLKVWRYVLVDHYSHSICVKYYQSRGETQVNLYDFLLYCWGQREGRLFHGVPKILLWDKGSANTAKAIKNALRALDVTAIEHQPGNPRAKGGVEEGNNLVECQFESRLRFEPVRNVDELNAAVEAWANAYNADAIPHYDARLKRKYMSAPCARYAIWQRIRQEQLRILPDMEVCKYLLSADVKERQVKPDLTISFKHPCAERTKHYSLAGIPNIYPRATVRVSPLVYGEQQIMVYVDHYKDGEQVFVIEPIEADEFAGFPLNAAVIGDEYKSKPDTIVDKAAKEIDKTAYPGMDEEQIKRAKRNNVPPFSTRLDAHSHLKDVVPPAFMRRPGTELDVPNPIQVELKPLSIVEAARRIRSSLDRALTTEEYNIFSNNWPQGIPEENIEQIIAELRGENSQQADQINLTK